MARTRYIKPGLFKNELLGTADPLLTILFESLWCLADRNGILEDRPLRIKAETFPYREITLALFNGYLTELERLGFIWRYSYAGKDFIEVKNFSIHQKPHSTEKASEYLTYQQVSEITVIEPLHNASETLLSTLEPLDLSTLEPENVETQNPANGIDSEHVQTYFEFFPKQRLSVFQQEVIAYRVSDGARWRKALEFWKGNEYVAKNIVKICDYYDELQGKQNGANQKSTANHYRLADELERQGRAEREAEQRLLSSGSADHSESDFVS